MTGKLITSFDLEVGAVTIDVPHGGLLAQLGAALGRWRDEMKRLAVEMAKLRGAGVFLDEDGSPVVPSWWEQKEGDQHKGWYLVWPTSYARRTGRKRRQYIGAAEVEATRAKVQRTMEYLGIKTRHDQLTERIERVGQELAKLLDADE